MFYVIEGSITLIVDGDRFAAERGSYVLIPGGTTHTFENRSGARAGFISFNAPGGFEDQAQPIADWLARSPLGDVRD